jgi:hypothetical protein
MQTEGSLPYSQHCPTGTRVYEEKYEPISRIRFPLAYVPF